MLSGKPFTLYRSSAGSGKTRTLARAYLLLALRFKADYFRHILAVTFTNKATQEMKDRILDYVDAFAKGEPNDLADEVREALNFDEQTFRSRSQEVQRELLHHYSQFSISTIDAFFQRVIRSFTRETGLMGDYRLEVEDERVLGEVVNELIDELGEKTELTRWVVEFARESLESERAWDVRRSLIEFSKEITREKFKSIEEEILKNDRGPSALQDLLEELRKIKYQFVHYVRSRAQQAMEMFEAEGLTYADFKWMGSGISSFMQKLSVIARVSDFSERAKGSRPEKEYQDVRNNWPSRTTRKRDVIITLGTGKVLPLLNEILQYRGKNYERAITAELVLSHFYNFGLITEIWKKLRDYRARHNLMLLSDAPKFLHGVIAGNETPFVYEKVGSFYRNFLIDEFQDTSGYQWKNFLPLLRDSLDQGHPGMVVGDVKQAIYRWRGGDLGLLHEEVMTDIGEHRITIEPLDTNYRSSRVIVDFNNTFFPVAAGQVAERTENQLPPEIFRDVHQKSARDTEGFVRMKFFRKEEESKWTERALEALPSWVEELQIECGASLKDIAVLVRRNVEGQRVAERLVNYGMSPAAREDCRYDVVSNESLQLEGAAGVNLVLAAMRYLLNPDDVIARARLVYEYNRLHGTGHGMTDVFSVTNHVTFESHLPDAFTGRKAALKKLPLVELVETLAGIFQLDIRQGELAYLQAFQDVVMDFYNRERNDLGAFLAWWEANKHNKSIQVSGNVDAISIFTLHKAKGLQFKYVIVPFCSWSMDHEFVKPELLWLKTEHPPFDRAGYLPVRYSGVLKESFFAEDYKKEFTRSHVDNLNLLYVAFTRAETGLMVMSPDPSADKNYTAGRVLYESLRLMDAGWDIESGTWARGSLQKEAQPDSIPESTLTLKHYAVGQWRDKLVIRRAGMAGAGTMLPARYGVAVHTLLSRLRYRKDLERVANGALREGIMTQEEREEVLKRIDKFFEDPIIADWFDDRWEVRTEIPILLPNGSENRIDRLLTHDRQAVVVDFKTGSRMKADRNQVAAYLEVLRKMGFNRVEGFLLYLDDLAVVPIPEGRSRKKDTNQLELDI